MKWSLVGVNGEVRDLTEGPVIVGRQPQVFGLPPVSLDEETSHALRAGSIPGKARHLARPVVVPLVFNCVSQSQLYEQLQALGSLLDPVSGEVRLIAERPDGATRRELVGRYSTGLQSVPIEHAEAEVTEARITLRCASPYWQDVLPKTVQLDLPVSDSGNVSTPFNADIPFNAEIPFNGWSPSVEGGTVVELIDYRGSAPVWPAFELDGPASSIAATNMTTGHTWAWTGALAEGETLRVETAELSRSVRVGDTNRYRDMDRSRLDFWPLVAERVNEILIVVGNANTNTALRMTYQSAHLTC